MLALLDHVDVSPSGYCDGTLVQSPSLPGLVNSQNLD